MEKVYLFINPRYIRDFNVVEFCEIDGYVVAGLERHPKFVELYHVSDFVFAEDGKVLKSKDDVKSVNLWSKLQLVLLTPIRTAGVIQAEIDKLQEELKKVKSYGYSEEIIERPRRSGKSTQLKLKVIEDILEHELEEIFTNNNYVSILIKKLFPKIMVRRADSELRGSRNRKMFFYFDEDFDCLNIIRDRLKLLGDRNTVKVYAIGTRR